MSAKRWWAIPMMAVGTLGALAAISVEMSQGQPVGTRLLVSVLLNMSLSPAVWVGIVGVLLWRSGSRSKVGSTAQDTVETGPGTAETLAEIERSRKAEGVEISSALVELSELRDGGHLTESEFRQAKAAVLGDDEEPSHDQPAPKATEVSATVGDEPRGSSETVRDGEAPGLHSGQASGRRQPSLREQALLGDGIREAEAEAREARGRAKLAQLADEARREALRKQAVDDYWRSKGGASSDG